MDLEKVLKRGKRGLRNLGIIGGIAALPFLYSGCEEEDSWERGDKEQQEQVDDNSDTEIHKFEDSDLDKISSYSYSTGNIAFTEAQKDINRGDFIVGGTSEATPYGFFGKVADVSSNRKAFNTRKASLDEAVDKGNLSFTKDISPSGVKETKSLEGTKLKSTEGNEWNFSLNSVIYDADGDKSTTDDQIIAEGSISFTTDVFSEIDISGGNLKYFKFHAEAGKEVSVKINAESSVSDVSKEVQIWEGKGATFYAGSIGMLPVYITPKIEVNVGTEGNVSVEGSFGASQEGLVSGEVIYDKFNGEGWEIDKEFRKNFSYDAPSASAEMDLKGYAGPEVSMLVYGFAGASVGLNAYGRLDVESDLEWALKGGLELGVGATAQVLGKNLADYNKTIGSSETTLASGDFGDGSSSGGSSGSGGKVVYSVENSEGDENHLAFIGSDGSGKKVLDKGRWNMEPEWIPGRDEIVYRAFGINGENDICKVGSDGSNKSCVITSGSTIHPTVSLVDDFGNNQMAYIKDGHIYISGVDGSYPSKITSESRDYDDLHWSHYNGGDNIYFTATSKQSAGATDEYHTDVYKIDRISKEVKNITNSEYRLESHPEVYGNEVVFSSTDLDDGSWDLYKIGVDGENEKQITDMDGTEHHPTWSSDGSRIYFISNNDIYRMSSTGGNLERITYTSDRKKGNLDYKGN